MTAAEIRGGVDGLVLGTQIKQWDDSYGYKLSEILEMYYSEQGIVGQPRYRACNRGSVFSGTIDSGEILNHAISFAYIYNQKIKYLKVATAENIQEFYSVVRVAYDKMMGLANPVRVLTTLQIELDRIKQEELRDNYQDKNGITVLFLNQGKKLE
ncbi:unnamed protein product, partial [Allacma fusca]